MLTRATFAIDPAEGPTFTGFHDPTRRWGPCRWATPRFERAQITLIMQWLDNSCGQDEPGSEGQDERLFWDGDTLVHDPCIPETHDPHHPHEQAWQIERLSPDGRGRYKVGLRRWTWCEVAPAPKPSSPPHGRFRDTDVTVEAPGSVGAPNDSPPTASRRRRASGRRRRRANPS